MAKNSVVATEMERLREKIRHHEYLYYVNDDPEISDAAFGFSTAQNVSIFRSET